METENRMFIRRNSRLSNWWDGLLLTRWPTKAALALAMLALVLTLCSLLTSCASPCRPAVEPNRILARTLDSAIGINCTWRY